uniref:Lipid-binding serum glycoprotein N-terminal domain-containing protein n=1 Tax=Urocitellus parryii TaxID=9999 RepID=A0A8D2GTS3_UROPR
MAVRWTATLLCGLLAATLAQATFSAPAVLNLGPDVIKERLTQKLKYHEATTILQQLPLLSAMREESSRAEHDSYFSRIPSRLKVTSAAITQLQIQPSDQDQELIIKIPLDMVAGFNTPLVKTIVEMHMQSEVEASIRVDSEQEGPSSLVLSDCFSRQGSLRISLLLENQVAMGLGSASRLKEPVLLLQLCPVIQAAFKDMFQDFLKLVRGRCPAPSPNFSFPTPSCSVSSQAKLLDSQSKVTKWLNDSSVSLAMPPLDCAPFSFVLRQDVLNAVVAVLLPPDKLTVLLDYVLPDLAKELKSSIKEISEQAAETLDRTQLVKFQTRKTPQLLLSQDGAQAAQLIVLDLFPTNKAQRPLFTLGIVSVVVCGTGGNLGLSSGARACLALPGPPVPQPLTTFIVPGKLRTGIPMLIPKALGYGSVTPCVIKVSDMGLRGCPPVPALLVPCGATWASPCPSQGPPSSSTDCHYSSTAQPSVISEGPPHGTAACEGRRPQK